MALKGAIDAKRLTATTVATLAGVTQPAISQFINIPGRTPEVPIFMAACQLLNLDPYQLVGVSSSPVSTVAHETTLVPASAPDSHLAFLRRLTSALVDVTARISREQTAETRTHPARRRKRNRAHRG